MKLALIPAGLAAGCWLAGAPRVMLVVALFFIVVAIPSDRGDGST